MTGEAMRHAFNLACDERDQALRRIKELEEIATELNIDNARLTARLRIVELMEEQAANRLGFQIPLRLAPSLEAHSLKVVQ